MENEITIPLSNNASLKGLLSIPEAATGIVVFAHGSGSGRNSPRNKEVAETLEKEGLATLLLDLLTESEEEIDIHTREFRFDIPLLASRLFEVSEWLFKNPLTSKLQLSFFGASTGSAAALIAASELGQKIYAVVSRGGRTDLAGNALKKVTAKTLFMVGSNDKEVLKLNEESLRLLNGKKKLEVIEGATHLFEEPGTLQEVAKKAATWFKS